jgi:hypothetical protein
MQKLGRVQENDGKDVAHKKALSKGGAGTRLSNLTVQPKSQNRSFRRNPDGSMKS